MTSNTMGLFTKKEKVPVIPTAPSLPPLPSIPAAKEDSGRKDLPGLPSFPTNSRYENINQEMVKSAISDAHSSRQKEDPRHPEIFPKEKESSTTIRHGMQSSIPELPKSDFPSSDLKEPKPIISNPPIHAESKTKDSKDQGEPIFVRIDKFQIAQKNFEDIKSKAMEVELILQKIKDIRIQEEEELKGWTEDVKRLKSQLNGIDEDIFSQL